MNPSFRAWDKLNNEMYVVEQINFDCGEFESIGYGITNLRGADKIELMQSTGLKDKNGKEIFEGDIISDGHMLRDIRHHQTLGFYIIDDNGIEAFFGDTASLEDFEEASKYISENIEIIGNIYENPEILKEKE